MRNVLDMKKISFSMYILIVLSILPFLAILARKYSIFILSSMGYDVLVLLTIIVFILATLWSVINFFVKLKTNSRRRAFTQFIFSIFATGLLCLFIYMNLPYSYDKEFNSRYSHLEEVVTYVQSGEIDLNRAIDSYIGEYKIISLPLKYRWLSKGGEIWYQRKGEVISIFFLTSNDFLYERFYGYVYRSDNSEPTAQDFDGNFVGRKIRLKENWFWKGQ